MRITGIDEAWRGAFEAIEPVEAKNVGRIHGWRTTRSALESLLAAGSGQRLFR